MPTGRVNPRYNILNVPSVLEKSNSRQSTKDKVDKARELFDRGTPMPRIASSLDVTEHRAKELITGVNWYTPTNEYKLIKS